MIAGGFLALFLVMELVSAVDYTAIADSTGNVVRAVLIPSAVAALLLAGLTSWLGWWRPVLRDDLGAPTWLWAVPALLVVGIGVSLVTADYSTLPSGFVPVLLVGALLVGFNEEIVFRGLAIVGFRGDQPEWRVWLFSSLAFGLLHGANLVLGQPLGLTVSQVGIAFIAGSVFYTIRRVTGTIVAPMLIHGLWDFSTFVHQGADLTANAVSTLLGQVVQNVSLWVAVVLFLVGARWMFRGSGSTRQAARPASSG
jgi:membrane protease YdiL (CAAX protease family)